MCGDVPRCAHLADSDGVAAALHAHKHQHHVVDDYRHTVVQKRLAKHQVVKVRVNSNLDRIIMTYKLVSLG